MKLIYDIRPPLKIKTTNSSCDILTDVAEEVLWEAQRIIDLREEERLDKIYNITIDNSILTDEVSPT